MVKPIVNKVCCKSVMMSSNQSIPMISIVSLRPKIRTTIHPKKDSLLNQRGVFFCLLMYQLLKSFLLSL